MERLGGGRTSAGSAWAAPVAPSTLRDYLRKLLAWFGLGLGGEGWG